MPLLFPKPQSKDRPNLRRKREIKKRDREYQKSLSPFARCVANNGCFGKCIKHHKKRRRFLNTRWNDQNALVLCISHHSEIHQIGEKTFMKKYNLD